MEVKHTPGPWTVCTDDTVQIGTECFVGRIGDGGYKMGAANAALIASAPGLLAALKKCVDEIEHGGSNRGAIIFMIDDARAAIAKAEGRS